ncbi:MAG: hypothetical protein AAF242_03755 [Bacteroidota bacterium]
MTESIHIKQGKLLTLLRPLMEEKGQLYQKKKNIFARKAKEGEKLDTITDAGYETTNTAKKGDYLVRNQTKAGESYFVSESKFEERYEYLKGVEENFSEYRSKGKIYALELTSALLQNLGLPDTFYFEAPWEKAMLAERNDYLVMPLDYSEVYRIAQSEFSQTYKLLSID